MLYCTRSSQIAYKIFKTLQNLKQCGDVYYCSSQIAYKIINFKKSLNTVDILSGAKSVTFQITKKWYCKYYFSKKQIIIEIITTLNSSILRSWLATIFNCATSDNATTETAFMFRLRLHSKRPVSALYLPLMSLILFWPYRQWQMVARELSHVLCKTISFH